MTIPKPKCDHLKISDDFNLLEWLKQKAEQYQIQYLLAHGDDGVIWGKFQNGELITTTEPVKLFPECNFPFLRKETLQQCRIFGDTSEVMIWKNNGGFKARLIQDNNLTMDDYIIENQILWGTQKEQENNGFTLVSDGQQGLRHAVPLTGINFNNNERPLRLTIHHYIDEDDSGVTRIYLSRLVNLTNKEI